jgi:hypothetical protein
MARLTPQYSANAYYSGAMQGSTLVDKTGVVHNYSASTPLTSSTLPIRPVPSQTMNMYDNPRHKTELRLDAEKCIRSGALPKFTPDYDMRGFVRTVESLAMERQGTNEDQKISFTPEEADVYDHAVNYMLDLKTSPELADRNQQQRIRTHQEKQQAMCYQNAMCQQQSYTSRMPAMAAMPQMGMPIMGTASQVRQTSQNNASYDQRVSRAQSIAPVTSNNGYQSSDNYDY